MNLWEYLDRQGERRAARITAMSPGEKRREFTVLMAIVVGLVGILTIIVVGLFLTSRPGFALPNWAENVLISIATACALKLGDCIAALTALATGRQIDRMGAHLANAPPAEPAAKEPQP